MKFKVVVHCFAVSTIPSVGDYLLYSPFFRSQKVFSVVQDFGGKRSPKKVKTLLKSIKVTGVLTDILITEEPFCA